MRKGQEEIVGFVLVVLIVSVVFFVFLGLSIRSDQKIVQESRDIYQFLDSSMEYTTECAIGFEPAYDDIESLIVSCSEGSRCTSGKSSCEVLNYTLKELIESSWQVGPDRPIKGYEFRSYFEESEEVIVEYKKGICEESIRGSEYLSHSSSGSVISVLRLCY